MKAAMLKIVLAESALELVPRRLWNHPSVRRNAEKRGKKPGEVLLDVSIHYHAMKSLPNRHKRGRPDIIHITLLELLSSPINKAGLLRVYVHTIGDNVIFIDPDTRLPRNYNRFVSLMEQLFAKGRVPPNGGAPLLYIKTLSLSRLLKLLDADCALLLDEKGELRSVRDVVGEALKNNCPIIIGGFPHGGFSEKTLSLATAVYSIYPDALETWVVASRVACHAENLLLPYG